MATTVQSPPQRLTEDQDRITLHGVSWETYESLLGDHENSSSPRFTFDRGELEIVSPLLDHHRIAWAAGTLVQVAARSLGLRFMGLGSTTFRRKDLKRGFEPDGGFYLANLAAIRDKRRLDLTVDPPPDLLIEAEVTRSSIDKLALYVAFGVPEVWRCAGTRVTVAVLVGDRYTEVTESRALPGVTAVDVLRFVATSLDADQTDWLEEVEAWARGLAGAARAGKDPAGGA